MSEHRGWGVDPGTANLGAVLVEGARPLVIIDIVSRPATKGRAATRNRPEVPALPKRLEASVWIPEGETRDQVWVYAYDAVIHDALDAFQWALVGPCPAAGADVEEPFRRALTGFQKGASGAAVERVMGNVSPDLADVAGAIVGILWQRCGGQRPKRPSAATWRRRMLDIPGNTPRAAAERVALERVREEVPTWPESASGHAAEAYWIARFGLEA